jgi:DNA repair protein RadD
MMRPTLSPGLYMQEVGRGLRPKTESTDCLVLDFAGNIRTHGPVADVRPPEQKRSKRKGVAPSKICPNCDEIVAIQSHTCPCCGYEWPKRETREEYHLHDDDINGRHKPTMRVGLWRWSLCKSRAGEDMVRTTYQRSFTDQKEVNEYFLLWRTDIIGMKSQRLFLDIVRRAGLEPTDFDTINDLLGALNASEKKPVAIEYKYNGRYANVTDRIWENAEDV